MASPQDIQSLLRFLAQDAKVPLAQAMGAVKQLTENGIITPADIAKSELGIIKSVFGDDKVTKQVLAAAKRISKKRGPGDASVATPVKKAKPSYGEPLSPAQFEDSLALPGVDLDETELSKAIVYTNRAPLVLAFAVTLLKYTMPEQPLSSRLSLAQAVVSVNSRTKAASLGLETGKSAEEEGWGDGQPVVNVMGREIRVMKRWGYQWDAKEEEGGTQETVKEEPSSTEEPALWGVDLEALKKSNGPVTVNSRHTSTSQLPIFTAQSARAYLLKSFYSPKPTSVNEESNPKKKKNASIVAEKERNLALLLSALELLFTSWSSVLTKDDLDKRAWGWYVRVRPEVESGVAGWGGKGNVKLSDILALRRPKG
ncbi:hypothetical protein K505DRAFT_376957 [Melanomma pulvis-pyrius CBS 109.77]|uniref:Impact N-terminal domain-containing protein n=1 Tax=Melanomma pulvis-pyrius CBS 109.77 TaxID=1314802 RepID=A0A6A6X4G9_9PLEO|nr:hypothetical protein K505DRAFT_376957 [Melanomma pulvis-pyrius CBS 109.77]